ncbi:MAG: hypothetical protein FIB05_04385 [Betaproteobacteria bacterium]|nr:hypothetical protein [Betaproteobacteria bacterium]
MKTKDSKAAQMRAEYDFTGAVRGKYRDRILKEGSNVVVLDPDVAEVFKDSTSVNDALRIVIKAGKSIRRPARPEERRATKSTTSPRRRTA